MHPRSISIALFLALCGCSSEPTTTGPDGATLHDGGPRDGAPPGLDGATGDDADVDAFVAAPDASGEDARVIIDGCEQGLVVGDLVRTCIPFPTGVQQYDVPPVEDSFNRAPPPTGTVFADEYTPGPGECSVEQHDRYWVRARDGHVYRTWHPPAETSDVMTGRPCTYGHEHGDDPRDSPLYVWAGGIPFGLANRVSALASDHRHEDHYGHKVFVQNLWEAALGNGPSDDPYQSAGFHCYWLSKVHQGTHSGDALGNNEHEYINNIMCDDGFARHPVGSWDSAPGTGPTHHTAASVRTLTTWGHPAEFKACDGLVITPFPGGVGRDPVAGSDTNREIKCMNTDAGWMWRPLPSPEISETGDVNWDGATQGGIDELWKPWMNIRLRGASSDIFVSSAYYGVRNPARLYNPLPGAAEGNGWIPRADWGGTTDVDPWIPTLEACFDPMTATRPICAGIDPTLATMDRRVRWLQPESPFNGTIRIVHPKGTALWNDSGRTFFCTDYRGLETSTDPMDDGHGYWTCPDDQILQFVAATQNLWAANATWGDAHVEGHIAGSMVNARSGRTIAPGYGHEWVRFYNRPEWRIHAPN